MESLDGIKVRVADCGGLLLQFSCSSEVIFLKGLRNETLIKHASAAC